MSYMINKLSLKRIGLVTSMVVLWVASLSSISRAIPIDIAPTSAASPEGAGLNQGLQALARGDDKDAEAAFQAALKHDPKRFEALLGLAEIALRRNAPDMAREYIEKARAVAPKQVDVETAWGRWHVSQKQYSEATAIFQRAMELERSAIAPRLDLADLYLSALRKPHLAADLYRQVTKIAPSHAGAHYGLGIAMVDVGSPEIAKNEWKEASHLAPSNPSPSYALGNLYLMEKQYDAALSAFDLALTADKSFAKAHLGRGDAWLAKGNDREAIAEYETALKVQPQLATAHEKIGMLHHQRKHWAEAERAYLAAIKINPKSPLAYNNLAWVNLEQNSGRDAAVRWARQAVDLLPQSSQFQDTLGWAYRSSGDEAKALTVLERAAAISPPNPEILYHFGIVLTEAGRDRDAITAFRKALDLKAGFPGADDARSRLAKLVQIR
jgi:Tfp pilus assembly protein PilF